MIAIEGSYGLIAFSTLGPEYRSFAFLCAVYAAIVGNVLMFVFGARGPLLSGPSAALALLVPPLMLALMADPRFLLPDGRPNVALLLAFVALGVMLTGAVQVVVGALRAGRVFRYVPYPVHAGVMNGVAVLMAVAMLPHVLGLADGSGWRDARAGAVAVALAAAVIAWRPMRWTRALPAYLTALLAATALHHALRLAFGESSLGPLLGPMPFDWPAWAALAPLARGADAALLLDKLPLLLEFAVAGALMASLQSMMAMALVDAVTRTRRDGERELLVQGLANIGAGCLGTLQNCGAISRSRVNIDAGGSSGASRAAFGLCLVLLLAAGSALLRHVPMAAIAGVFLAVAFSLVDGWSRRATGVIARRLSRAAAPPRSLTQSYAVMLLVAGTTVFVSLSHGLALGVLAAMVMFIRSNSRQPIRAIEHADRRTSRKVRPAHVAALLREHGRRIAVLELDGPLFFGTADVAAREIERLGSEATQIVVDFTRVSEVDASGARVLVQAAEELHMARRRLLLAALPAHDLRRRTIREMDVHESLAEADFFDDADLALESRRRPPAGRARSAARRTAGAAAAVHDARRRPVARGHRGALGPARSPRGAARRARVPQRRREPRDVRLGARADRHLAARRPARRRHAQAPRLLRARCRVRRNGPARAPPPLGRRRGRGRRGVAGAVPPGLRAPLGRTPGPDRAS